MAGAVLYNPNDIEAAFSELERALGTNKVVGFMPVDKGCCEFDFRPLGRARDAIVRIRVQPWSWIVVDSFSKHAPLVYVDDEALFVYYEHMED